MLFYRVHHLQQFDNESTTPLILLTNRIWTRFYTKKEHIKVAVCLFVPQTNIPFHIVIGLGFVWHCHWQVTHLFFHFMPHYFLALTISQMLQRLLQHLFCDFHQSLVSFTFIEKRIGLKNYLVIIHLYSPNLTMGRLFKIFPYVRCFLPVFLCWVSAFTSKNLLILLVVLFMF